ncbi:hypothetical protein B0J15DRAFT_472275 [Fusarium solani]|uniref:Uncharacterized protein n=1 Tax=Fusarium solani TaxID=169388 RepID=A0A9P9JXH8_FUSSL|nr:uncharacterized protein B0J15DRAFT_472275 [Fusarium solani]KAH7232424.1 hypothetical protein B0J15DRAFT_472275 [Fusarium solani]
MTDSYAPVRVGVQDIARPLVDTALTRRRNLYRTGVGIYLESNLVGQCDSVWQLLPGKARQPADLRQEYNRKEARERVDVEVQMCRQLQVSVLCCQAGDSNDCDAVEFKVTVQLLFQVVVRPKLDTARIRITLGVKVLLVANVFLHNSVGRRRSFIIHLCTTPVPRPLQ